MPNQTLAELLPTVTKANCSRLGAVVVLSLTVAISNCGEPSGLGRQPTRLSFSVQPTDQVAGGAFSPAVKVAVLDVDGDVVTHATTSVTVALAANPGSGTLAGTRTVSAVGGVATFADLSIDNAAAGYTLTASAATLSSATSNAFIVAPGEPTQFTFTTQPSNASAGEAIAPAVAVTLFDAFDNVATNATTTVTLELTSNPGDGTLSGTTTVDVADGVASFDDLSIDKVASGYVLTASATDLANIASDPFAIDPGAPAQLAFLVQPSDATAGATISPALEVEVWDAFGNLVTSAVNSVTMAIADNPGGGILSGTTSQDAVDGVATFDDLSIDKAASGYTITAGATGLTGATSEALAISAGAASQLAFATQPSDAVAGELVAPTVEVQIRDAAGNLISGATDVVTISIGANPGGGTLSGTLSTSAVDGVATFGDLSIEKAGADYTLVVSATGLTGATSSAFAIAPAAPAELVFTSEPTDVIAGETIAPPVEVTVLDAFANVATNATLDITLQLGGGAIPSAPSAAAATLNGTTTVTAVNGVATFDDLWIDEVGTGYSFSAGGGGLASVASQSFATEPASASQLFFTIQPSDATANATMATVEVSVLDEFGNVVTGSTDAITLAMGTNPTGGTLSGTTTQNAVNGVANFSDLSIDQVGDGYTLTASATALTAATSSTFDVLGGRLAFRTQPSNATAGAAITPSVQVEILDSDGNLVTGSTDAITLAIGANPAGGTLSGAPTQNAVNGVATFANLSIDMAGAGYTLSASGTDLTGAASNPFNISPAAPSQLVILTQPSTATAGVAIAPPIELQLLDPFGNLATAATDAVTLAIGANPSGGTLAGTTTQNAVAGVATFADLSIDKVGADYTLDASATGLSGTTTDPFAITVAAASQLAFRSQPSNATAGELILPAIEVELLDPFGNLASGASDAVTIAVAANPGGGTLSGTVTVNAVDGVATFSDLSLDQAAEGYTLGASATGLSGATSNPFDIDPASGNQLAFRTQPSNTNAGAVFAPPIEIEILDEFGNLLGTATDPVTLVISANPGGGSLSGTTTVNAVGGVATFTDLSINRTGTGYSLAAIGSGLISAVSDAFAITPAAAAKLVVRTQPSDAIAGVAIAPAIEVEILDVFDNLTNATDAVTLAIGTNPSGGTLAGTTTQNAVAGVATFADLSIDKVGSGYRLDASASGLSGTMSNSFAITPAAAAQLAFAIQPSGASAGALIAPALTITVLDDFGNVVPGATDALTLTIGTNPGGGALSGTTIQNAVNGVATFADLSIDKVGNGYTLDVDATGLTGSTSDPFDIMPASAARLAFSVEPNDAAAGAAIVPPIEVQVLDAFDNVVTGATDAVTLAMGDNPGSGTLSVP